MSSSIECTCCEFGNLQKLQNPSLALKNVLNNADRVVVIAIRWYKPGKSDAWKETFVSSVQHALIDYGDALHEDRIEIQIESAERDGEAHQMACNNNNSFKNRLRVAKTTPNPSPPVSAPVVASAPAARPSPLVLRIPVGATGATCSTGGPTPPIKKRGRPPKST